MAIDYLYWYGAFGAMREHRIAAPGDSPPLGVGPASREIRGA
jgi:hypothetical protein